MKRERYKLGKFQGQFFNVDLKNSVTREQSNVDGFYKVPDVSTDDGEKCVHFTDPIYIIFNNERLKSLGADSAMAYLDQLMSGFNSNPLAELRAKCSDEDLLRTIKSRHLQSPSELLNWSRYMAQNQKEFDAAVAAAQQSLETPKTEE